MTSFTLILSFSHQGRRDEPSRFGGYNSDCVINLIGCATFRNKTAFILSKTAILQETVGATLGYEIQK